MKCGIHIWEGLERTRAHHNPYEREMHKYISAEWTNGPVPGAEIFGFDRSPIGNVNYEDTEHYRIYKEFMKNRKKFLS